MDSSAALDQARKQLAETDLPPQKLYEIAGAFPDLFPQIAAHPQAYPELLNWLQQSPDPLIAQVIALREQGIYGEVAVNQAKDALVTADEQADAADNLTGALDIPAKINPQTEPSDTVTAPTAENEDAGPDDSAQVIAGETVLEELEQLDRLDEVTPPEQTAESTVEQVESAALENANESQTVVVSIGNDAGSQVTDSESGSTVDANTDTDTNALTADDPLADVTRIGQYESVADYTQVNDLSQTTDYTQDADFTHTAEYSAAQSYPQDATNDAYTQANIMNPGSSYGSAASAEAGLEAMNYASVADYASTPEYSSQNRGIVSNDQATMAAPLIEPIPSQDPYYSNQYPNSAAQAGMSAQSVGSVAGAAYVSNMPAAAPSAPAASPKKKSSLNVVLALILVVALVSLGIVLFLLFRGPGNAQEDQQAAKSSSSTTEAPAPRADEKKDDTVQDAPALKENADSSQTPDARPVPPNSVAQAGTFTTQYGNIICEMTDQGVTCTILKHQTGTCGGAAYTVRSTQSGVSSPECTMALGSGSQVISYNQYYNNGTGVCYATESAGMECYNTKTGHGFRLRQAALETF